jgi:hypothetical protein
MMVCCETLQIFAASPVVNTVFIFAPPRRLGRLARRRSAHGHSTEPAGTGIRP